MREYTFERIYRSLLSNSLAALCIILWSVNLSYADDNSGDLASESVKEKVILQFDIEEEIFPAAWRLTKAAVEEAEEMNADVILIRMNTYGGLVDVADSIRTKLMRANAKTIVYIDNNAASAGALISIACDSIFMSPGAQIGAATVVNETGEKAPDKYQSYMRATMRSTAESLGRDPTIAEAMVDESIEIRGIVAADKILTFTTEEAIEHGYCDGEYKTIDALIEGLGLSDYKLIKHERSRVETIISFLTHPMVSGFLLMIMFAGIYFELQTPGVGFPIGAAIIASIMYFAPHYLQGLADNWEIILFVVGLLLLLLEMFVIPGFGVAGVSGLICIFAGAVLSMLNNDMFDFGLVSSGNALLRMMMVFIPMTLLALMLLFFGDRLLEAGAFKRIALQDVQDSKEGYTVKIESNENVVGKTGTAKTVLRPSGKVVVDGELYDATSETDWIEPGTVVKVVRALASYIIVRPLEL